MAKVRDEPRVFLDRLTRGPAGLLLGQRHLALGTTTDPLLEIARRKLNLPKDAAGTFDMLFQWSAEAHGGDFLDWLDNKARTLAVSEQLESIAKYPWVGVWSSAIDTLWADAFQSSWREVQKVFGESYRAPDPRNRRRLHCTFLFGSINRSDPDERPPVTRLEYLRRRGVAQSLARRIPEVIGPIGTLAIDGYGGGDWFTAEDLVGVVAQLQPGQVHLFNATEDLGVIPELIELRAHGLVVLHAESLASVLADGARAGILELGKPAEEGDLQRLVSFADRTRSVPRDLWVSLSSVAHLLDESVLSEPKPLSEDARYAAFRQFLGSAEARPDWEGLARGFAFGRDFEQALDGRVAALISQRDLPEQPIIVHGATGTGKTTALASLALRLARDRTLPVLFVDGRTDQSASEVIDQFCQWAEEEGASASVVAWDGMFEAESYEQLARFFAGRGRRVALVGSCYRIPGTRDVSGPLLIHAPGELTPDEVSRLGAFLGEFDDRFRELIRSGVVADSTFLAYLYRILPPTRAAVRRGVLRELEYVERKLIERSAAPEVDYEPESALGWALLQAGLVPRLEFDRTESVEVAGERFAAIEDLAALVMVPAQFGLAVPLELVLRATGQVGYANVPKLLHDVDLVRWVEDQTGNFHLTARSRLEAQLIVRSRLGSIVAEAAFARRLLVEVRDSQDAVSGSSEIKFAIDFVRALGAQGQNPERYVPEYRTLAAALRELREDRGLLNPRLMLQEANLLREWSIKQSPRTDQQLALKVQAVIEASNILTAAFDHVPVDRRDGLRNILRVELAATLATQSKTLAGERADDERLRLYLEARDLVLQARNQDQSTYYPVDILAWATRDTIRDGLLEPAGRAEAIADVLSAFELMDTTELDASQVGRFHERRQQFAELAGESAVADEAFAALAAQGSGAGVYLRARALADPAQFDVPPTARDLESAEQALAYLAHHEELVQRDSRCMNFWFDLWWLLHAGQRPFADERFCVPFTEAKWREAIGLIDQLERSGPSYRDLALQFLRGLAEFHLDDPSASFATFDEVLRRSEGVRGRRRIVRAYLASTPEGRPQLFHGTVSRLSNDLRRGEVYVEELRRGVTFLPREFRTRELARGVNLGDFHIAFNFLGIVADPPGFLRGRREAR